MADFSGYIFRQYKLSKVQEANPLCKFYAGSEITNSVFGEYNVVFKKVVVINCNIASHSYIQKNSVVINAVIGKFCSIASNVSIGPGKHKMDGVSTYPAFYLKDTPLAKTYSDSNKFETGGVTNIGHDVWIGERAIIQDGINIGTGAIIASGAVVTKDVPPYAIVGGVPARIIKYRFAEKEVLHLLASAWWDRTEEWREKNYQLLLDTDRFLKSGE